MTPSPGVAALFSHSHRKQNSARFRINGIAVGAGPAANGSPCARSHGRALVSRSVNVQAIDLLLQRAIIGCFRRANVSENSRLELIMIN